MDRWSATSLFQLKTSDSLSIQRARYSLAAPCSITAKICKKAAAKSRIRTRSRIAPAAKVSLCDFRSRTGESLELVLVLLVILDLRCAVFENEDDDEEEAAATPS